MPIIDTDEYDKSVIPAFLKKEEKELIDGAVIAGWTLHISGGSVTLIAPPPNAHKKIHLGRRSSIPIKRMQADVVKFGDPLKMALARTMSEASPAGDAATRGLEQQYPSPDALVEARTVVHEDEPAKPKRKLGRHLTQKITVPPEVLDVVTPPVEEPNLTQSEVEDQPDPQTVETAPLNGHGERTVISSKPLLVRAGSNRGYDSLTTLERLWSDGTRDFLCTRCDYQSDKRLSVSRHYANIHRRGKGAQGHQPSFRADVPDRAIYAPRQSRVDALAVFLADLDRGEDIPWTEVARQALTWVHEQTADPTVEGESAGMDDAEVLDRIRSLLNRGERMAYQRQMEEMEQQVLDLTARLEQAEELALEQTAKAERAASNLKAFTELVTEMAGDDKDKVPEVPPTN